MAQRWNRATRLGAVGALTGALMLVGAETAFANQAPNAPTGTKTELLSEALGLNTKSPALSWTVNDPDADEAQSAYRVVVSSTSALTGDVYDSGWVSSAQSSSVRPKDMAAKLKDNQLYYWQVQTKDKDGAASPLSAATPFMTGIGSEWQSLKGIWARPGQGDQNAWADYTADQTVRVTAGGALGLLVRADAGSKNAYMVQLRTDDNQVKVHQVSGGSVNTTPFVTVNLADSKITLPTDGSAFKVRMQVTGSKLTVFVATSGDSYVQAGDAIDLSGAGDYKVGGIGYRTGRSESGTVDDVKVTAADGAQLYADDFSSDTGHFSGVSVKDGVANVGTSAWSVWADPDAGLQQIARFSFFRSPKLKVDASKVDKVIVSAAARGTAKDRGTIYDLFVNGQPVGAGSARELANVGKTNGGAGYTQVYYNSYDVTKLVRDGDQNVVSAVGNARDDDRGILVQVTAFYKDGTKQVLTNSGTDGSGWKVLDGTDAFGDKGDGIGTGYVTLLHENIDAAKYPAGFKDAAYDDSAWADAQPGANVADAATGTSGRVLYPYSSENALRVEETQPTKKIYVNKQGNVVVDLGKEIIGGLKVNIKSDAEQKVVVHQGEEMNADGTVKYQLTAHPVYEDTWTLQKGTNAFETVTMRNVRYVELIGLDDATKAEMTRAGNLGCVSAWAIHQAFDNSASSFEAQGGTAADTLLNRLYELSKYSIEATNQDVYVDSQARERAPYEGDLLVNSTTSFAVSNSYSLARHSNEWLIDNPTWPNDYHLFSVEMAYLDYEYTGNADSLNENYQALKTKLVDKIEHEDSATGLIRPKGGQAGNAALIDWPTSERDGYQSGYYDVVFNSELVGIYADMSKIAEATGHADDAKAYAQKSAKLKETLLKYAYDEQNGCFYDSLSEKYEPTKHSSTHATAYALAYGVFADQAQADKMADFVFQKCHNDAGQIEFKGSVYVTYFILKGLYVSNNGAYAEQLMTAPTVGKDVKTYASLLDDLQVTITPEAWGHAWKKNMTMSHPWGAAPGGSVVQGLFGINPVEPGFKTFEVKLQPGAIKASSVKVPTIAGTIEASYTNGDEAGIKAGKIAAKVKVPANTTAKVYVPVAADNAATDQKTGELVVDGVKKTAERDGKYLVVELGSGAHAVTPDPSAAVVHPESVKLDRTELALQTGKTAKLTAAVTPDDATNKKVTWKSSDEKVAKVSADGTVTAVKAGTATITATTADGGKTATCRVTVTEPVKPAVPVTGVKLDRASLVVKTGKTARLKAEVAPADATNKKVTWKSSDEKVAKVSADGTVTGVAPGTATITATTADGHKAATAKVSVFKDSKSLGFEDIVADGEKADWVVTEGWLDYAVTHGLMSGYNPAEHDGKLLFGPYDKVSRAQLAVMLYRLAGSPTDYQAPARDFKDNVKGQTGNFWYEAVRWANSVGVITGYEDLDEQGRGTGTYTNFGPADGVTREAFSTMLHRYAVKVAKVEKDDVSTKKASTIDGWDQVHAWARDGVAWSVNAGLVSGVKIKDDSGKVVRSELQPRVDADRSAAAKMVGTLDRDVL